MGYNDNDKNYYHPEPSKVNRHVISHRRRRCLYKYRVVLSVYDFLKLLTYLIKFSLKHCTLLLFGLKSYHGYGYISPFLTTKMKDLPKIYELAGILFLKHLRVYKDQFYAPNKYRNISIL
jgi:hypothetical protein